MGGYIRIDKEQAADQRLYDVADELARMWHISQGTDDLSRNDMRHALRNALLGGLVTLWIYADTHIKSDNSLRVTLEGLAPIVGLPVTMLEALPDEWLTVNTDGYVMLPGYCEKNHIRARDLRRQTRTEKADHERELGAERARRYRANKREDRHGVTSRINGRDASRITPPTGTGPGSLRPNPGPELRSTETHAQHDALASAQGHLARRADVGKRGAGGSKTNAHDPERKGGAETNGVHPPAHSMADLQTFAYRLADEGNQSEDIARMLARHGVTGEQVRGWLSNRQPPAATAEAGG